MPDRVIDAPIPDEELAQRLIRNTKGWMQERIAQLESLIESGDNPDGALIYRSDHDKIVARLEAEKQEARTEGWNACVVAAEAIVSGDEVISQWDATRRVRALSKPKPGPSSSNRAEGRQG